MLVTADAEQVKGILNMGSRRVVAMALSTLALIHPCMMAQSAFGTLLMMKQVIEGYRAELPLARKNHGIRTMVSKSLSTDSNQKNSQRNKDNSFHANPTGKRLKLLKHVFTLHFSNFAPERQQLSGPRVRRSPIQSA